MQQPELTTTRTLQRQGLMVISSVVVDIPNTADEHDSYHVGASTLTASGP